MKRLFRHSELNLGKGNIELKISLHCRRAFFFFWISLQTRQIPLLAMKLIFMKNDCGYKYKWMCFFCMLYLWMFYFVAVAAMMLNVISNLSSLSFIGLKIVNNHDVINKCHSQLFLFLSLHALFFIRSFKWRSPFFFAKSKSFNLNVHSSHIWMLSSISILLKYKRDKKKFHTKIHNFLCVLSL